MLALAHLVSKAVGTKPYLARQIVTTSVKNGVFFADEEDKREFSLSIHMCKLYIRVKFFFVLWKKPLSYRNLHLEGTYVAKIAMP